MFDLKWVSDTIDEIIQELSEYSEREPEIKAAVGVMLAAKRLIATHSDRILEEPYKSSINETKAQVSPTDAQILNIQGIWSMSLTLINGHKYREAIDIVQKGIAELYKTVNSNQLPYDKNAKDARHLITKMNTEYNSLLGTLNDYINLASQQTKKRP